MASKLLGNSFVAPMPDDLERYRRTRNPLYLWSAIHWCLWHGEELPAECRDYLLSVAAELSVLSQLKDPRPNRCKIADQVGTGDLPTISPERAMELVPDVLRLRRKGVNRLATRTSDRRKILDFAIVDAARRSDPGTVPTALEKIKARRNLDSDRSARRRVEAGGELAHPNRRTKPSP